MSPLPSAFLGAPLAHRALHDVSDGRPENSRAAIRAAIAHGYGIEIDLQLSADNQAIVFHDYHLKRLTGRKGPVRRHTADELAQIMLSGGRDEGIPMLSEVLELVAGQVPLLIEIKDQDGVMGPNVGALEQATIQALAGYCGPVAVMSFNPHAVAAIAELAPDLPRGLATCAFSPRSWSLLPFVTRRRLRKILDYEQLNASFVSHDLKDLDNPRLPQIRAAGGAILSWTITSQVDEQKARCVADNVTFERYLAKIPAA